MAAGALVEGLRPWSVWSAMRDLHDLDASLRRIDGAGYGAYKDLKGAWDLGGLTLFVDHVQGDPFAAPSRVRARVAWEDAGFPSWTVRTPERERALCDYLTRAFAWHVRRRGRSGEGSGKSGLIDIDAPRQEVLARTSVVLGPDWVEARFACGLPARGRRVLGRAARRLLCEDAPGLVEASLHFESLDGARLREHLEVVEDQAALRRQLGDRGLVAFIADGSRLPRRSGVDPRPLAEEVVPTLAPDALAVELEAPHAGRLRGLGIPEGITLIVGGGYHGKSTLLAALELGIYDHVPGDGREQVITRPRTVKVRAEDGRRVEGVDISAFIDNLPFGRDTRAFRTDDASGSTSQAAAIVEALEAGATTLLMDEDTSATNFMIRDHRMQALVAKEREPITPYIDRARQLMGEHGVSTLLVVGGAGDYFDIADTVIRMDAYLPRDATAEAHAIAERFQDLRTPEASGPFGAITPRRPDPRSLDASKGRRDVKVRTRGVEALSFGVWDVDLGALEQLVDPAQTRAIAEALLWLKAGPLREGATLAEALDALDAALEREGLDLLARGRDGGLAQARRFEVAAALNRLRSLRTGDGTRRAEDTR